MAPDPSQIFDWLDTKASFRNRLNLTRSLRPRPAETSLLDLSSNDYLGLATNENVVAGALDAVKKWGAGATASRLVSGTTQLHADFEQELAAFSGTEAALVFSSGYAANLGVLSALCGPDTLIVADAHNHASLIDGYKLTGAEVVTVAHCDLVAYEKALANRRQERALVVTDAVFSVDGDSAPLKDLLDVARNYGAALVVDDAHGFGVLGSDGRGSMAAAGIQSEPDVVTTMTLSKSLGSQGGAVLGPRRVVDHLINSARTFIFDTALAPACVGAASAALRHLQQNPDLPKSVIANAQALANGLSEKGLSVNSGTGAVLSLNCQSAQHALDWASACREKGLVVACFRPPSVPRRQSRIRVTARADLTPSDIEFAVDVIASHEAP